MARLRTLASDGAGCEVELKPGINRLGRAEDNDFQILDPTVSAHHCVIEYKEGVAIVRDLGSTNGTFVNALPVQEAILKHGQVLRLGTFELLYEQEPRETKSPHESCEKTSPAQPVQIAPPMQPGPPPIIPATSPDTVARSCGRHFGVPAKWVCVRCRTPFCSECVKVTKVGMREFYSCIICGATCITEREFSRLTAMAQANFFSLFPGAFTYPLQKGSLILLVVATFFLGFFEVARTVLKHFGPMTFPHLWMAYWLSVIFALGYVFIFMQNIVVASAHGDEKMPDLPELSSFWDEVLLPFLRLGIIWAACLAPGFLVQFLVSPVAGVPLYVLGLACVPMAILTVSMADSLGGLNPVVILSGIAKVPIPYLVTCVVFMAAIAVRVGAELLLKIVPIPILPTLLSTFIGLYGLAVGSRLLGLIYFTNKEKLAWF